MIAYTRTNDYLADKLEKAVSGDLPIMVIDSVRSKSINFSYSELEAVDHGLDEFDRHQSFRIPDTTKLIVIRKKDLPAVKVKELIHNLEGIQWETLSTVNHGRNEYAYRNRAGDIKFKIRLLRKERILTTVNF